MAPNKKKKKPASNPARGFATVSTASKVKAREVDEESPEAKPDALDFDAETSLTPVEISSQVVNENTNHALHDLSPEELENKLEESALQLLVETHGHQVKREVSRQVSKLQTERRLLRNQAEPLGTRQWLPTEVMELITNLLDAQQAADNASVNGADDGSTGDDYLIKLWTLKQILPELGFTFEASNLALRHLVTGIDTLDHKALLPSKDSIWGLDVCLRWLALTLAPESLPKFESEAQKPSNRAKRITHTSASVNPGNPLANTQKTTERNAQSNISPPHINRSSDEGMSPSSWSGSDSDLEPEQLVEKYLTLQARLYEINPKAVDGSTHSRKVGKNRLPASIDNLDSDTKPAVKRLTGKLDKIRADVLFDEDEANRRWTEMQVKLAREHAERTKLGVHGNQGSERQTVVKASSDFVEHLETSEPTDEAEDMLGELFANLPENTTNASTGVSDLSTTDSNGHTVEIRDFGKWTGMSPRRVLEETIRSRDPLARVIYKPISASTFSNRHSVSVAWSRIQEPLKPLELNSLAFESDHQVTNIEMISIACPDNAQSEAYVSTVGLFWIFASSQKEEKAYLRLPAAWRDLWFELSNRKKDQEDAQSCAVLRELRDIVDEFQKINNQAANQSSIVSQNTQNPDSTAGVSALSKAATAPPDSDVKAIWTAKSATTSYQHMLQSRKNLPIWHFKRSLLTAIDSHQVIIICGETGCGKSTQVPAYILEQELSNGRPCKVYCTEPRRISAISLARRVSEELGEKKGDVGTLRSLVGYAIRLESQITSQTRLVYATTGIVMRILEGSNNLQDITHLVLDEVHERSIDSDFLLIVLRKLLACRRELKVILMSATVDAQKFSTYLDNAPIMTIPGRAFPVETRYLEDAIEVTKSIPATAVGGDEVESDGDEIERTDDSHSRKRASEQDLKHYSAETRKVLLKFDEYRLNYNLIVKLLVSIATIDEYAFYSKAILVFLPGIAEIRKLHDTLAGHPVFRDGWYVHALHSTIATEEQELAFLVPPQGKRKIVLATNIAETGITIPDVTCVVDTGKHKEMRFDERRQLSRLIEVFISRANAKQRRGRAGRVQKGLCFHLFTKHRHDNVLPEEQTPEMLRLSLQDLVLRVKICKLGGIEQTLTEALDPPSTKNIRRAIDSLVDVKALTALEELTALGRQLAKLPLDVFLGKLILLGTTFGCPDAMLTIAAILSSKSPFTAPMGARSQMDTVRLAFRKGDSDLLTVYNAYCAWRRICTTNTMPEYQFCRKNFLSLQTLSSIEDLKVQLTTSLVDAGFMKLDYAEKASLSKVRFYSRKRSFVEIPPRYNSNRDNDLILNSVIAWSFYPKLLRREGKGWRNIANNQAVSLHPTSVNKGMDRPPQWLSFYHIMQSSNKFYNAHETSPVEDMAVALVCGEAEFKTYSGVIVIDGNRIRFSLDDWKTFAAIRALRTQIRQIMAQSFKNPGRAISPHQQEWLKVWEKIFSPNEGKV